jgi:hypothetical protein
MAGHDLAFGRSSLAGKHQFLICSKPTFGKCRRRRLAADNLKLRAQRGADW